MLTEIHWCLDSPSVYSQLTSNFMSSVKNPTTYTEPSQLNLPAHTHVIQKCKNEIPL